VHADQTRKGTNVPYFSHLLAVASLVLEAGGDETAAIAALLHDAAEDSGGQPRLDDIRARFGDQVAEVVEECSDTLQSPKPPWQERKQRFIARIPQFSPAARLVNLADLVHNARSIRMDLRTIGEELWDRFNGGKEGTIEYYRQVTKAHGVHGRSPLHDELADVFADIERMAV